jgi:hypothetical protein
MEKNKNKMVSKITIIVLLLIIIILVGGIYYLVTDVISKDKIITEKEKTIQTQNEAILKAKKEAEKPKEEKELSKEEYLKIFKELVGTDFPGYHNERANDKKIEIIENPKEGIYLNSKYFIRKSDMLKQRSSGIAEGEYNILTKEEVKKLLYDFAKKMGYSDVVKYEDDYETSENNINQHSKPYDLKVNLEAKNSKNGTLRLGILFLRDKNNKVTNKVYSAYVGIY